MGQTRCKNTLISRAGCPLPRTSCFELPPYGHARKLLHPDGGRRTRPGEDEAVFCGRTLLDAIKKCARADSAEKAPRGFDSIPIRFQQLAFLESYAGTLSTVDPCRTGHFCLSLICLSMNMFRDDLRMTPAGKPSVSKPTVMMACV